MNEHKLYEIISQKPILETGVILGVIAILLGIYFGFFALTSWEQFNFGDLPKDKFLRIVSFSSLLIVLGGITILSSLLMGFVTLPTREKR